MRQDPSSPLWDDDLDLPADVAPPPLLDEGDDPFAAPAPPLDALHAANDAGLAHAASPAIGSIPRIAIHAACDRHEIARLMQVTAKDRRMAKAEVTVELGGIEAAAARFSTERSPHLLILDSIAPPPILLQQLSRLAEVVEGDTRVVIIGAANDITLYRELMRRGVSEYLVAPLQPVQIIESIAGLFADPDKPFTGKTTAVMGAKGGVGASTIAHNLAWLLAERIQLNTTLVDLDLPFGTAALDFNNEPPQTVLDALTAPERVDEVFLERSLARQTERLMLFAAPAALDRELEVDPDAYETVIEQLRRSAPHVVLDLPHLWSPWMRQTLLGADEVLIVATPDLASLRNTKNLLEKLTRARANDAPPSIVLNMAGVAKRPEIPMKDFAEALGAEPTIVIPFDAHVFGQAAVNGQMICEVGPTSKAAIALESLAVMVSGRAPAPRKKAGLESIFSLLKR